MTPMFSMVLVAMFIAITIIKVGLIWQKKEDLHKLKGIFQTGTINQIANDLVNKIRHDKRFETVLTLLIFGDCFMFMLDWFVGLAQFIFSMVIILLLNTDQKG